MAKFPILSRKELLKILEQEGFQIVRQKGSHVSLRKGEFKTVVPLHPDLSKRTLLGILKQCGLTKEKLIELMK
jgi:predicted RNA binding protein YcfA (HicA-like mRNA interferase family)